MRLLVNSFGGVGSKSFVRGCIGPAAPGAYRQAHAHLRHPPPVPPGSKVVYLFDDPCNAVVSFFNRRRAGHTRRGFVGSAGSAGTSQPDWAQRHCRHMDGDWQALSPDWELADYLDHGVDLFGLDGHYDNWRRGEAGYPVLFVRFRSHWSHLAEIADFLDLPRDAVDRFPPWQPRQSDWTAEPPAIRAGLDRLYGPLRDRLAAEPDLFVAGV